MPGIASNRYDIFSQFSISQFYFDIKGAGSHKDNVLLCAQVKRSNRYEILKEIYFFFDKFNYLTKDISFSFINKIYLLNAHYFDDTKYLISYVTKNYVLIYAKDMFPGEKKNTAILI